MAIKDKQLELSDGQTGITATGQSTNIYDAGNQGDAIGGHDWIVVKIKTSLTSADSTATVSAVLETADDSGFTTNKTTLIASGAIVVTSLTAGTYMLKALIPLGVREFLRITYTVAVENLTGGAFDAFIVLDADQILNY